MAGEVTFQLTEADLLTVYRDQSRSRSSRSGSVGIVTLFVALAVILLWVAASNVPWLLTYEQAAFAYSPYLLGAWAFWTFLWILSSMMLPRQVRRRYRQRASFRRPRTYSWSAEGLGVRTSDTS